jgi:hypothetical protein
LDEFRTALLQRFDDTYEGEVHKYLVCEILRELDAGKTLLSQKYYAEHVLRTRCTYDYWDCIPALTPMVPGTRLTKEQCDPHPEPTFHRRRGIPDREESVLPGKLHVLPRHTETANLPASWGAGPWKA